MIAKMILKLGNKIEIWIKKIQEMFGRDLEEIKNEQTKMKNTTITDMKNMKILAGKLKQKNVK